MGLHESLKAARVYAFDFETTGLDPYLGDRVFSLAFAWREEGEIKTDFFYSLPSLDLTPFKDIFADPTLVACAHNAKFEGRFILQAGLEWKNKIWDTEVFARIEYNDHMSYTLEQCASRIGLRKDDAVKEYIKLHRLSSPIPGHKTKKKPHFDKVPRDLIDKYNRLDAEISLRLYEHQRNIFQERDNSSTPTHALVKLESETTPRLLEMEHRGIKCDVAYCRAALEHERRRSKQAKAQFEYLARTEFKDSAKQLRPIFDKLQLSYGKTEKGNASFTADSISQSEHPLVKCLLEHRDAEKRATTYFDNFLRLTDSSLRIHANLRQCGTASGRLSCTDPNVQNWPDDSNSDTAYPVRRAFIAEKGYKLVSIDYSQMELRFVVDAAQDMRMIKAIQEGIDFHQETADMAGVSRNLAKNGRFAKLYGAGYKKVAETLGIDLDKARKICDSIDETAPEVARYLYRVMQFAKQAGWVSNWMGRRYYFNEAHYKAGNYVVQGGCSDVFRVALRNVSPILKEIGGYAVLPIHDELVFEIPENKLDAIPRIRQAMIDAFECKKALDFDVSVGVGDNLHDLKDWNG